MNERLGILESNQKSLSHMTGSIEALVQNLLDY